MWANIWALSRSRVEVNGCERVFAVVCSCSSVHRAEVWSDKCEFARVHLCTGLKYDLTSVSSRDCSSSIWSPYGTHRGSRAPTPLMMQRGGFGRLQRRYSDSGNIMRIVSVSVSALFVSILYELLRSCLLPIQCYRWKQWSQCCDDMPCKLSHRPYAQLCMWWEITITFECGHHHFLKCNLKNFKHRSENCRRQWPFPG